MKKRVEAIKVRCVKCGYEWNSPVVYMSGYAKTWFLLPNSVLSEEMEAKVIEYIHCKSCLSCVGAIVKED